MSRYIDADKLQLYLNDYAFQVSPSGHYDVKLRKWNEIVYMTIDTCMKAVDEQPTADVRENIKGKWIKCDGEYRCSNCNRQTNVVYGDVKLLTRYCPNCGAQMYSETL